MMKIATYVLLSSLIMTVSFCVFFDFMRLKTLQRIKLLEEYCKLYFSLKTAYKCHDNSSMFDGKNDFLCFHSAFRLIFPYIQGFKKWSNLSDWETGMLVEPMIKTLDKYSSSHVSRFIDENILSIMQRSVVLLFPVRIYLLMRIKHKRTKRSGNPFTIGGFDFSAVSEEFFAPLNEKSVETENITAFSDKKENTSGNRDYHFDLFLRIARQKAFVSNV